MSPNSETKGYCPACGRGDCSPTAEQWSAQLRRAEAAEGGLIRLRNRIAALEENGAELLRRTEKAEADLAELEREIQPSEEMPTDPAELAEMWNFLIGAWRWNRSMAIRFDRQRNQLAATVKRVEALRDHWRWTHAIDAANELSAALSAPDSPAAASTAVSAATEAHGGAGEAQEGSQ